MLENNLPAFYILPPNNLKKKHPILHKNLVDNSQKLTSFWDANKMLRKILSMATKKPVTELFKNFEGHGESLFHKLKDRTCAEAEIPENYCTCTDGVTRVPGEQ